MKTVGVHPRFWFRSFDRARELAIEIRIGSSKLSRPIQRIETVKREIQKDVGLKRNLLDLSTYVQVY